MDETHIQAGARVVPEWPDWEVVLDHRVWVPTETALRNLACYANPELVARLGLGRGGRLTRGQGGPGALAGERDEPDVIGRVWDLADALVRQRVSWTVERFNPRGPSHQVILTTEELLEGEGTCLDFAVSLAALCEREDIPVVLAVAVPDDPHRPAHAFVIAERLTAQRQAGAEYEPGQASGANVWRADRFQDWVRAFREGTGVAEHHLVDVTPRPAGESAGEPGTRSAQGRSRRTLDDWLAPQDGWIYTVAVRAAVAEAGYYYRLPTRRRDLGIRSWLPDLPADYREFPSRRAVADQLEAPDSRNVLLIGERGTGKSTLALARAQTASGGRGWFLDGSDRPALLASLAAAEARSQGRRADNEQQDYLATMSVRARHRLASTAQPWVVVVDNADGKPADIIDLLPAPKPGQLLIVTTTNEDWLLLPEASSWAVEQVRRLGRDDLADEERELGLHDSELLPGLLRIARHCTPENLAESAGAEPGPRRLVRAALGLRAVGPPDAPVSDVAAAVVSAAFMPAEKITVGWIADGAFDGDGLAAGELASRAAGLGLLEHSRESVGASSTDEEPLWMHRGTRAAIQELTQATWAHLALNTLACKRARRARYSQDELAELARFLPQVPEQLRSHSFAQACVSVMELLEPRGSTAVRTAASIGSLALDYVQAGAPDAGELRCVMLMAQARAVNQSSDPTDSDIERAIEQCKVAEEETAARSTQEDLLLSGRAQAMHGILIRKKADRLDSTAISPSKADLLTAAIDILTRSYRARREALTVNGVIAQDPDHHIDRGWFNLGGANIALANYIVQSDPARLPDVPRVVGDALAAYAGSLSLRRDNSADPDTMYTAASLWGVALALYTAVMYCPGELSLDGIEPVEELDPVRRQQTRETLLRAAELTVSRSLEIRAAIDGPFGKDTAKSRDLLRKISLAWPTASPEADRRRAELLAALRPFLKDARIQPLDS